MAQHTETEIKLEVASAEAARAKLLALGARLARERHLEDNVLYDDASGSLRRRGVLLRLRRAAGRAILTYKGRVAERADVKAREELEVEVSDADAVAAILAAIGLLPCFRYQKYRESYVHGNAEIVIDETPIGTFLEIEADPAEIHALAQALGFSREDYVLDSYVTLFLASGQTGDMVFEP